MQLGRGGGGVLVYATNRQNWCLALFLTVQKSFIMKFQGIIQIQKVKPLKGKDGCHNVTLEQQFYNSRELSYPKAFVCISPSFIAGYVKNRAGRRDVHKTIWKINPYPVLSTITDMVIQLFSRRSKH